MVFSQPTSPTQHIPDSRCQSSRYTPPDYWSKPQEPSRKLTPSLLCSSHSCRYLRFSSKYQNPRFYTSRVDRREYYPPSDPMNKSCQIRPSVSLRERRTYSMQHPDRMQVGEPLQYIPREGLDNVPMEFTILTQTTSDRTTRNVLQEARTAKEVSRTKSH